MRLDGILRKVEDAPGKRGRRVEARRKHYKTKRPKQRPAVRDGNETKRKELFFPNTPTQSSIRGTQTNIVGFRKVIVFFYIFFSSVI